MNVSDRHTIRAGSGVAAASGAVAPGGPGNRVRAVDGVVGPGPIRGRQKGGGDQGPQDGDDGPPDRRVPKPESRKWLPEKILSGFAGLPDEDAREMRDRLSDQVTSLFKEAESMEPVSYGGTGEEDAGPAAVAQAVPADAGWGEPIHDASVKLACYTRAIEILGPRPLPPGELLDRKG